MRPGNEDDFVAVKIHGYIAAPDVSSDRLI